MLVRGEQVEQLAPQILVAARARVRGHLNSSPVGYHFSGLDDIGSVEEPEYIGPGETSTEEECRIPVAICNS